MEEADNEQSKLANGLKDIDKGVEPVKKYIFEATKDFFIWARKSVLNNFKSRIFSIKDNFPTPAPEPAPEPA